MIRFACPSCDNEHQVEDSFAGYTAKCSHCGQLIEVPQDEDDEMLDESASVAQVGPSGPATATRKSFGPSETDTEPKFKPAAGGLSARWGAVKAWWKRLKLWAKIAIPTGALILIALPIILFSGAKPPPPIASTPSPTKPPEKKPEVKVAPKPPVELYPRPPLPPEFRTAARFQAEYLRDPIAANKRFHHHALEIQGMWAEDEELGQAVVSTAGSLPVFCEFSSTQALQAAVGFGAKLPPQPALPPGHPVTVLGLYTDDGRMVNCEIVGLAAPADSRYKEREIEVDAVVQGTSMPATPDQYPFLVLEGPTSSAVVVRWMFKSSEGPLLASLRFGQKVTVRGTCGGRIGQVVRMDNCRLVNAGESPAANKITLDQICRDYEADLTVNERPKPTGKPVPITAEKLALDYQADPVASQERYGNALLEVSGAIVERHLESFDVVLETTTNGRYRVRAVFSPIQYQALGQARNVILRAACSGSRGRYVQLDDAVYIDPDANAPRITLDYFPLSPGMEYTYYRAEPQYKAGTDMPIQQVTMKVLDYGEIFGHVSRKGFVAGNTLLGDKPLHYRWRQKFSERKPLAPFAIVYRLLDGFIQIGHVQDAGKQKEPTIGWEPILKLGAKAGESWEVPTDKGQIMHYTVVGFRHDEEKRSVVEIRKERFDPANKFAHHVERIVYARGIGEVEHVIMEKAGFTNPERVTSESKLISYTAQLVGPPAPEKEMPAGKK